MKAVIAAQQGPPEVLEFREVEIPEPGAGRVLIRIKAMGINPVGAFTRKSGYCGTSPPNLGVDFAGIVTQTGSKTTK